MNIFSNLFSKKKSVIPSNMSVSENEDNNVSTLDDLSPNKDLFIDSQEPKKIIKVEQQGKISLFLGRNFLTLGLHDGYEYRSSEQLIIGKRKIGAEFRLILDQEIQEKEERFLQVENLIIDVSSVSPLTLQKLQNTLQKIGTAIEKLEKQKQLSIEEEGWVMNGIYNYQQGFTQGVLDYLDTESLLNSIKNI